jgi:3,4-dihydroxy 2-butanone 4-phosphate synthase/GTP cyclohydrolase II
MTASVEAAIARVRAFAEERGWTKSRLAIEAGMSNTVLRDFDKPDWNPTVETLRRIEAIIPKSFGIGAPERRRVRARSRRIAAA